jgi:hypothetical protein
MNNPLLRVEEAFPTFVRETRLARKRDEAPALTAVPGSEAAGVDLCGGRSDLAILRIIAIR